MSHVCFGLLYIQIVHFPAVEDSGSKETWSGNPALTLSRGALGRLGNHWVSVSSSVEWVGWQDPTSWAATRTGRSVGAGTHSVSVLTGAIISQNLHFLLPLTNRQGPLSAPREGILVSVVPSSSSSHYRKYYYSYSPDFNF